MLEKLEIIMSLFAGIILLIAGFIYKTPLLDLSIRLLATMVVFYIIGLIIKRYLRKTVFNDSEPGDDAPAPENKEDNEADKEENEWNEEDEQRRNTERQQPDEEV